MEMRIQKVYDLADVLEHIGYIYVSDERLEEFKRLSLKALEGLSIEEQFIAIVALANKNQDAASEVFVAIVTNTGDTASDETLLSFFAFIADHFADVFEEYFGVDLYEDIYNFFRKLPLKKQAKFFRRIAWDVQLEEKGYVHDLLEPLIPRLNVPDIGSSSFRDMTSEIDPTDYKALTLILERLAG
jgi:hypothetical protein